jgi:general secretion pathway protein M
MNALLEWYRGRDTREQRLLLLSAGLVPIVVFALLLLNLYRSASATSQRLSDKQSDLVWLRANASQLGSMPSSSARSNESLVTLIDRVARDTGMAQSLTGSQSSGNGGLRVRAEKAGFDALIAFLGSLSTQHGVVIDSASVESSGASGIVNATLVLRQP